MKLSSTFWSDRSDVVKYLVVSQGRCETVVDYTVSHFPDMLSRALEGSSQSEGQVCQVATSAASPGEDWNRSRSGLTSDRYSSSMEGFYSVIGTQPSGRLLAARFASNCGPVGNRCVSFCFFEHFSIGFLNFF